MSEEIQNAPIIVPWAIVFTYFFNGILGLGIMIATLFCISDLEAVLEPPSGFAFIEIFRQTTYSIAGTTIMVSIITIMQLAATVSILTAASRQLWSFARDRGVPGWRMLGKVRAFPRSRANLSLKAFLGLIHYLPTLVLISAL